MFHGKNEVFVYTTNLFYNISWIIYHLDESVFSSYFAYLEENNSKEANQLLFELYNNGYDLSDILFFLYNYVKEHSKYNYAIEVLCDYMNEYYNGHNHQVFILFLTLDIQNKKKS